MNKFFSISYIALLSIFITSIALGLVFYEYTLRNILVLPAGILVIVYGVMAIVQIGKTRALPIYSFLLATLLSTVALAALIAVMFGLMIDLAGGPNACQWFWTRLPCIQLAAGFAGAIILRYEILLFIAALTIPAVIQYVLIYNRSKR